MGLVNYLQYVSNTFRPIRVIVKDKTKLLTVRRTRLLFFVSV